MSDHIGKLLAEITPYGSVHVRGEIVGETKKTWVVLGGDYSGRVIKGRDVFPATPEAVAEAREHIDRFIGDIQRKERELIALRADRRAAIEAALRGE